MSKHDSDKAGWRGKWRRANRAKSIRKRVVRVALIPSTALILLWLAAALYLGGTGFYDQQVASGVRQVSIPAVAGLASVEKERQLSIAYLAQPSVALQPLLAQQKQSDQGLTAMQTAAGPVLAHAPQSLVDRMTVLTGYIGQLATLRGRIDAGIATKTEVSALYNKLLDSATDLFGAQARVVPDASVVPGAIAATNLFHISDLMSRAGSIVSGALASGSLSPSDYLQFTGLVGAYHAQLESTESDLRPSVQTSYQALLSDPSWTGLVTAENAVIERGSWSGGVPANIPVNAAMWRTLTDNVSSSLTNLTVAQADQLSAQALSDGNTQLAWLAAVLAVALLVVIGSIWWARRQSTVLVDSALVTRLGKLRADAQDLVDVRLPEMVSRMRAGDVVDIESQLPDLHYGQGDEIDQVATAISAALRQAGSAAAGEAQARNALNTVFRGIARRNQLPLYNLLSLLDTLEQAEQDPASLERLYRLDHEATRARRNSENLIILSGGDLGHHLPGPVRMRDVLRSAISETHEYQRVKLRGVVPDVAIVSDAVTGLIHLIAELLENAARFSPPSYEVLVRSMPAQVGVIVEVEDRGLGMPEERRERVNVMLANPPEVDVMAIGDGSQLGFWVIASLIKRFGFKVVLRESDYGGILAIVRVPNNLVTSDSWPDDATDLAAGQDVLPSTTTGDVLSGAHRYVGDVEDTAIISRIPASVTSGMSDDIGGIAPHVPEQGYGRWSSATTSGFVEPTEITPSRTNGNGRRRPVPADDEGDVDGRHGSGRTPAADRLAGGDRASTAERTRGDGIEDTQAWPSGLDSDDDRRGVRERVPLPQRAPGDHLNPRLTFEPVEEEPADEGGAAPQQDVGTALSAFQQGSEAGRRTGDPQNL